jgi:hypothetical protein
VPKVHNKLVKRPRKGSNKKSKRQPKCALVWRTGLSGVPPDSVRCTTRQCSVHQGTKLRTAHLQEFWEPLRYNSPDCPVHQRSNGYFAPTVICREQLMRYCARRGQSRARRRTWQWTVTVRCITRLSGGPEDRSSNGRSLTVGWRDWRTGQCPVVHRTVQCAMRQQPPPTAHLVVGAINTPNHPPFIASKFSAFTPHTRAITFNTRHNQRDQILSQVQRQFQSNSD